MIISSNKIVNKVDCLPYAIMLYTTKLNLQIVTATKENKEKLNIFYELAVMFFSVLVIKWYMKHKQNTLKNIFYI